MRYDPIKIQPFRDELTQLGIREMLTPEHVDETISQNKGTLLVVINSVCGCAARQARPAIKKALEGSNKPESMFSVFAGQELEATARLRDRWLPGLPPSSPSIALFRNQELVHFVPRNRIEGQLLDAIADELTVAFNEYCRQD